MVHAYIEQALTDIDWGQRVTTVLRKTNILTPVNHSAMKAILTGAYYRMRCAQEICLRAHATVTHKFFRSNHMLSVVLVVQHLEMA